MIFILNVKPVINSENIRDFLISEFKLLETEVNEITVDNENMVMSYEVTVRNYPSELQTELCFYLNDNLCLEFELYNDLQLAIKFSDYFFMDVIFSDQSNDPYRWILLNTEKELYIVDEQLEGVNEEGFYIDYKSAQKVSEDRVLSVLPSKDYFLMDLKNRPVFYNSDPTWGHENN